MFTSIRPFVLLAFIALGFSLSACETMEGAGRDISHAGDSIENAAD